MCGEPSKELVGEQADPLRLGRAPPRPRRARLRRPARPHRDHAARDQPRAGARGGRARAPDPQRVRPPRRGHARRAKRRDRQPETCRRARSSCRSRRSRSSAARRRCRSSSTRRTSTRRLRLRYRWLDLRRDKLQRNITLRAQMVGIIRREMEAAGFLDIQTPILFKPTPEGARDFVVPSRLQPGRFYALPQSPQILKQLTMVAGFDRYYQIAICFRDEDLRADRVQEITQLDVEMSFPDQELLYEVMERMYARIWRECLGIEIATPFPRMTFEEADRRFGTDKPDTRFGLELEDATEVTRGSRVRRLRRRRGRALPARAAGAQPRRPGEARGAREGVGREGARVPRLRRGGRGALADREVPLRGGAGGVSRRARRRPSSSPPTRGRRPRACSARSACTSAASSA